MSNENEVISQLIEVINETGIHARPASHIFQTAGKFKSNISIKKGDKVANAKSIISILGLGVKFGEKIQVVASGEDAALAVNSIVAEIKSGLGEGAGHSMENSHDDAPKSLVSSNPVVNDFSSEVTLNGVLASPGLVVGKSYLVAHEEIEVDEISNDSSKELKLFEDSLQFLKDHLLRDIELAKKQNHKTKVEVFNAHLKILEDESLIQNTKDLIQKNKTAGFAWKSVIKESVNVLINTGNAILIERAADLKDLQKRLLQYILGIEDTSYQEFAQNTIILAHDLVPSDIIKFDKNVVGVALAMGSATAHVALMLRNMGTPCVVVLGDSLMNIPNDTNIILDANDATMFVNPSKAKIDNIVIKQEKMNQIKEINIKNAKMKALTTDGREIKVKGNVSNPQEASTAFDLGAEGVGLLRTEFLFFNSHNAPSEETQKELYQGVLDAMQGGSVTFRTLDVGGDKPLSYVKIGKEENPIVGLRGVRNYGLNMDVFATQIRAILQIKPLVLTKVMIPMISEIHEMIGVKKIIEDEKQKLGIKDKISIGTMIEVPSAALLSDKLSKYVDFFSIGTNDLTQYALAMDRGNSNLTGRLKNLNPSVLKLIKMTLEGGAVNNIPTAVCGAMASEIKAIPILVGLGIQELSTSMRSIPDVKALIRSLNYEHCRKVAQQALDMETPEDVVSLVDKEFGL